MSQDTYEFENGKKLRIVTDRILVRGDELEKQTKGGLWMPEKAMEHVYRTGTVLAFGYQRTKKGERHPIPEMEVGLKVCFVRFLAEQHSNLQVRARFGDDDVFFIGPTDVMFMWPASEKAPEINL